MIIFTKGANNSDHDCIWFEKYKFLFCRYQISNNPYMKESFINIFELHIIKCNNQAFLFLFFETHDYIILAFS